HDALPIFAAAAEQRQRRNAADVDARARVGLGRGVERAQAHPRLQLRGGGFEVWRHHPAGAAPWSPEVHEQRQVRTAGVQVEVAAVQYDRARVEQPLVAAAAAGGVAKPRFGHLVERAAVDAGDLERGAHDPASKLLSPSSTRPSPSTTVTATSMPWRTLWVTTQNSSNWASTRSSAR